MQDNLLAEQKLRKVVRNLLETETGTEEPSEYTLVSMFWRIILEKIIPIIEDDYKMLTTSRRTTRILSKSYYSRHKKFSETY